MFNCFTPRRVVVGVDVGTGSARAGVFDASYGARLATASAAIRTWTYGNGDFVEQSGDDIWRAVCLSVREAVSKAGCPAEAVVGVFEHQPAGLQQLPAAEKIYQLRRAVTSAEAPQPCAFRRRRERTASAYVHISAP